MELPPFPVITDEILCSIAERHDLGTDEFTLLPQVGIFNKIYQVGDDFILRISREHPKSFIIARIEAIAVPVARAAGVRTPRLLAMDDTLDILPAPYTVYVRVRGETLGLLELEPCDTPTVWRELGHDLARLHTQVEKDGLATELPSSYGPQDLRTWPDELAKAGYFTSMEARWIARWLDRLAPAALSPPSQRLLHGDSQTTNIMVESGSLDYLAVIDWGSARWGDPAYDFAGIPLRAVPYVLEGYRQISTCEGDEPLEPRILWRHLEFALGNLRREPLPGYSWAERPMTILLEIMRFMIETLDTRWREWGV